MMLLSPLPPRLLPVQPRRQACLRLRLLYRSTNATITSSSTTSSTTASSSSRPTTRPPFPADTLPGAPGAPGTVKTTATPTSKATSRAGAAPVPTHTHPAIDPLSRPTRDTQGPKPPSTTSASVTATTFTHTGVDGKPTATVFIPSTATYCYGIQPEGTGTPQTGPGSMATPPHVPPTSNGGSPDPSCY
jgi:hypothetical protein